MIQYIAIGSLGGIGLYLSLLGKAVLPLKPEKLRGNDDVAVIGLILLFLTALVLPTCFGVSLAEIRDALEDIWSTGGGAGTG